MLQKTPGNKAGQQGVTMLEALISLLILAFGILGLAQVQARMLVQTRGADARATAIRLIADLGERVRLNSVGAQPGANADYSATLSPYSTLTNGDFAAPEKPTPDCGNAGTLCSSSQQAAYDVWAWHQEISRLLMNGRASIWQVSPHQLQVIIAWQANENTNATLTGGAADRQVASPLLVTGSAGGTACASNTSGLICHIDFIDIPTN
ncbi:MAG: type IV pilus modification protein PilV [Azonexus sp.]|jgi:type IV pilus assembly protein PilV|nr:type IV pilus modification protein PilV [Azonexus sp.]